MERPKPTPEQLPLPTPLEVNFDAIPETLQERQQWVVWKYAIVDGEIKKPPLSPRTGKLASVTNRSTWGSFAETRHTYETQRFGQVAGVGIVLTSGIVGIDLDHCIADGVIGTDTEEIITFLQTYTEISPSGTGIRLLLHGTLPGVYRRRGTIEMYETSRYLTITGQRIANTPAILSDNQERLTQVYHRLFPPQPLPKKENTGGRVREQAARYVSRLQTDEEVLQKAYNAKNGATFKRYYDGDYSLWEGGAKHRSHSEADFTLVLMLLYWTNGDTFQVDRLFRQSGLMREKWDRPVKGSETYGERLISDAIRKGRR